MGVAGSGSPGLRIRRFQLMLHDSAAKSALSSHAYPQPKFARFRVNGFGFRI